ncbi:hypothetical protein [Nitrosomonas sp.]|nr:hypothetical protein [Nitrosomonas sp.]
MGVDVDSVSDVIDLEAGRIRLAPEFGSVIDTEYITGWERSENEC